jgi:hypothetical protein
MTSDDARCVPSRGGNPRHPAARVWPATVKPREFLTTAPKKFALAHLPRAQVFGRYPR